LFVHKCVNDAHVIIGVKIKRDHRGEGFGWELFVKEQLNEDKAI